MNKEKQWRSHAQWPESISTGTSDHTSHDSHGQNEAMARNVARILQLKGLGGEGKEFPVRTWVTYE